MVPAAATNEEELPLPTIPRRRDEPSMFVPILLLFLIPYAIATTGFIAWLLYSQHKNFDPLERLPDPKPSEGGPRQIKHDLEPRTCGRRSGKRCESATWRSRRSRFAARRRAI